MTPGGREVAHRGVCATKSDGLCSTLRSPILETADFHKLLSASRYAVACLCTHKHIQIKKCRKEQLMESINSLGHN